MLKLARFSLIFAIILPLIACSRTAGSHTTEERHRLAKLHSQLSFEFMLNENLDVAQGEAEEALRLDPTGVESNHAMARVQQLLNDQQKISLHYNQALKTDPYAVVVLNDYGQYLCQHGEVTKALKNYDLAGSQLMNPQRMVSYTRAAACSINNQKFDQAEKFLLKALDLNPNSTPVLLNLVRTSFKNNEFDKANNYLEQYMKIEIEPAQEAINLAKDIQSKI